MFKSKTWLTFYWLGYWLKWVIYWLRPYFSILVTGIGKILSTTYWVLSVLSACYAQESNYVWPNFTVSKKALFIRFFFNKSDWNTQKMIIKLHALILLILLGTIVLNSKIIYFNAFFFFIIIIIQFWQFLKIQPPLNTILKQNGSLLASRAFPVQAAIF